MKTEEKLQLAKQVMRISGIFALVVAAILLINFYQLKKYEPLESNTLNFLVEKLKQDNLNEQLREEIRDFDLIVRKAYFTSAWQVKTGTYLLLFGVIIFGISLKVYTDLRRTIGIPEKDAVGFIRARTIASNWLLVSGLIVMGLAVAAGFLSKDHLQNYFQAEDVNNEGQAVNDSIEIVEIVDPGAVVITDTNTAKESMQAENPGPQQEKEAVTEAVPKETVFGFEEFKKQHNTFRGPMGQGKVYHKNIPVKWEGASGTNIVWKVAIDKPGFNSPIIWGDKLFIAGADETARIVSCFNRNTGQLLWEKAADNIPGSPAQMPAVSMDTGLSAPTMASDGYRVFAIFATGDVIAFDFNGNRIWARNLGVPRNHYGHSSSLMVWNGKLIVQYDTGTGGRMLALDTKTGETVWDIQRDNNISWASPILVNYAGMVQVVTNTDPNVAGYNVETGEEIWKLAVMMGEVGPSCAYDDGLVFANNEYASLVAINPEAGASVKWESYDYLSEAASPVANDGFLYLATSYGVLVCYNAKTGEQVWEKDFGTTLYSSPMIADGKIYLMDNKGVMHILKEGASGEIISEPDLGEESYAIPAFAEGRIYIRGVENLYCIGE